MTGLPACSVHSDRPAVLACARCGSFVCDGCVVSDELCADCRTRLLREGIAWGTAERGRQRARKLLRGADLSVRALSVVGSVGLALVAFGFEGSLPPPAARVGQALLLLAGAFGLAAAVFAAMGYRSSELGRPGPGVDGVVTRPILVFFVGVGVLPTALWLLAWLT